MAYGDYFVMSEWLERMDKTGLYDKATLLRLAMLKKGLDVLKLAITINPIDIYHLDTKQSVLNDAERAGIARMDNWDVAAAVSEPTNH